ncbi:MAG: hypothetical protein ACE5JJ_09495 [Nitrospinota bacterium]
MYPVGGIGRAYFVPHAMIAYAGEREEGLYGATTAALREAARTIAAERPDVLVLATPHWPPPEAPENPPAFRIDARDRLTGTYREFLPHVQAALPPAHRRIFDPVDFDYPGDPELAETAFNVARSAGLPVELARDGSPMDHGSLVPLLYLHGEADLRVLRVSVVEGLPDESYRWGDSISTATHRLGRRAVFVASGTLSHPLHV